MRRIGVDVGGTFTDAVLYDEDRGLVASSKTSSTHPNADRGVITSLDKLDGATDDDLRYLVHGTTVATNAVLERSSGRVALICTEGFRDVLEIARLMRDPTEVYDLKAPQPPCLVQRRDRFEVRERTTTTTGTGAPPVPLDEDRVREIAGVLRRRDIASVAVSLLHSYADGRHERRIRDILGEELPDVHVSLSCEVLPEHREYERTSSTVLNSYLVPAVSRYLQDLDRSLQDWRDGTRLWVMQSNGGVASPARAAARPVSLLLSGPSGGVVAGRLVAEQAGLRHSLTVDMGGTSFDACLLPANQPSITHDRPFLGMPVSVPSLDVMAIGAGGGSIGWVDNGGLFQVGPTSAGADPGPACYGRGGEEPTVTDANLVLGVIGSDQRLAGEVTLDEDAAWRACEKLGRKIGLGAAEAAWGLRQIVNTTMAGAVRAVSVARGYDPREFGLIAFGGAGPMHALDIAHELDIATVVLPPLPGCHSAVGLVVTDVSHDYVTTVIGRAQPALEAQVTAAVAAQAEAAHADLADEGVEPGHRDLGASLDMRYVGEQTAVNVPLQAHGTPGRLDGVIAAFHRLHEQLFGFRVDDEPVEIVNVRLQATGRLGAVSATMTGSAAGAHAPVPSGQRLVRFGAAGEPVKTPVYLREDIEPGAVFHGAAIVEQNDTTCLIDPGSTVRCDAFGNLVVTLGKLGMSPTGTPRLDPVTLAVLRSALVNTVAEMKAVVVRTAYSNLWKEAGDLSCGLLTADGDLVVPGVGDIPIHMVTMPTSLAGCLERFPADELRPNDVLFQNDPYRGNNHLPDFLMAKPVFVDERIVAFTAVRGHYVDVGGVAPGSYTTATADIYGEGLRIPPVKIFEEGVLNNDIVSVLLTNTRNSNERMGDLRSQYAGCLAAERRVIALCDKYGAETLTAAMRSILDASERAMRDAIGAIPDGAYTFADQCDGDGRTETPFTIAAAVTVAGDEVTVDFTGSSPQVSGGMNAPPAVTASATMYALNCVTDHEQLSNSGSLRPVTLVTPPGTVVNPNPPASVVAGNHETAARIADTVLGALASVLPDRVCAAGSGTSGIVALGARVDDGEGRVVDAILVETHGAGQGANDSGDGVNARRVSIGNTGNTPCEVLEATFPITVLSYGVSPDGGGAGRWRGGTGITRTFRLAQDCTVTLTAERGSVRPYGLYGGLPAPTATFRAELPDGTLVELPSKTAPQSFPAGTVITFRCAGGGGYGPAHERDLERVQADLDDEYVGPDAAVELYGVQLERSDNRPEGPWIVLGREPSPT